MTSLSLALVVSAIFIILKFVRSTLRWRSRTRGLRFPPGPRSLPVIGNLLDVPRHRQWEGYRDMAKKYGDLMYFNVLGQHLVVVGSTRMAYELLDKHAANTSDRPLPLVSSLVGVQWMIPFARYGPSWRMNRRLFWQYFSPAALASGQQQSIQREECHMFLARLLDNTHSIQDEVLYMLGSSVLRMVYNIRLDGPHDPIVETLQAATEGLSRNLNPSSSLVELIPGLQFLPKWLPFMRRMESCKESVVNIKELPYKEARTKLAESPEASMLDVLLERITKEFPDMPPAEREEVAKGVAGSTYTAAVETSWAVLQTFFLAMTLYPDVQKRAQAEFDLVVGSKRLPDFQDKEQLPYIISVVKEVLRWMPILPFCAPHATIDDDEVNGYFIPAGTAILANAWAMAHDPDDYPEPERFMPERFLKDGELNPAVRDPSAIIFGFGRRICAGLHFADSTLFMTIASVLAVFDITPPLDANGLPIRVEPRQRDGMMAYPEDCRCTIRPRSDGARALILEASVKSA